MMDESADNPGVIAVPPFLYGGAFLVASAVALSGLAVLVPLKKSTRVVLEADAAEP